MSGSKIIGGRERRMTSNTCSAAIAVLVVFLMLSSAMFPIFAYVNSEVASGADEGGTEPPHFYHMVGDLVEDEKYRIKFIVLEEADDNNHGKVQVGDGTHNVLGMDFAEATSIIIPDTVEDGGKIYDVTAIGDRAFSGSIVSLTDEEIKTVEEITCFQYTESLQISCESLESVVLPESITSIGEYAFSSCLALAEIAQSSDELVWGVLSIPTSVVMIGYYAFHFCGTDATDEEENTILLTLSVPYLSNFDEDAFDSVYLTKIGSPRNRVEMQL